MSVYCNLQSRKVLYLECQECEYKTKCNKGIVTTKGNTRMNYEENLIRYILTEATNAERREFFGHDEYNLTEGACDEVIKQMPEEEFEAFVRKFNING